MSPVAVLVVDSGHEAAVSRGNTAFVDWSDEVPLLITLPRDLELVRSLLSPKPPRIVRVLCCDR